MEITYRDTHIFAPKALQELFLSLDWASGHYPHRLVQAMQGYSTVFSAWDGDRLVGLVCVMDDGVMTAYVHYLLVHPDYQGCRIGSTLLKQVQEKYKKYLSIVLESYKQAVGFYQACGFGFNEDCIPMQYSCLL